MAETQHTEIHHFQTDLRVLTHMYLFDNPETVKQYRQRMKQKKVKSKKSKSERQKVCGGRRGGS